MPKCLERPSVRTTNYVARSNQQSVWWMWERAWKSHDKAHIFYIYIYIIDPDAIANCSPTQGAAVTKYCLVSWNPSSIFTLRLYFLGEELSFPLWRCVRWPMWDFVNILSFDSCSFKFGSVMTAIHLCYNNHCMNRDWYLQDVFLLVTQQTECAWQQSHAVEEHTTRFYHIYIYRVG